MQGQEIEEIKIKLKEVISSATEALNFLETGNIIPSEIWYDLRGYEGEYQISNKMRVRSIGDVEKVLKKVRGNSRYTGSYNLKGKQVNVRKLLSLRVNSL